MTLDDLVCEFCQSPAAELGGLLENENGQRFIVCGCSLTPEGELIPEIGSYDVIMTWGFEKDYGETLAEDVFNRILEAIDQSRGVDLYVESPDGWKIGITIPGGGSPTSSSEEPPGPIMISGPLEKVKRHLEGAGVPEQDMKSLEFVLSDKIYVKRVKWLQKDDWNRINSALKKIGGAWDKDSRTWEVPLER